ncbi:Major facilitator superfamily permease [Paramicrosporidium saccamoebae]|uniref:Major facilitator superfamily permease n=1 Tax=Paramicrosporidium saccamoebae TaxID=1246581 RepID=A0A2H9TLN6_9FUNG|nr:Major facilitator superfamily permease [Paramicrosporidium saccamoebae]
MTSSPTTPLSAKSPSWWQSQDRRHLLSTKLIYFWTGSLMNMFYVYRPCFFEEYLGFRSKKMGYAMAVFNIGSIIGVTLWSRLADVRGIHKGLFIALCLGMSVTFEGITVKRLVPEEYWLWLTCVVMGLFGLVYGGLSPLMDFQILRLLKDIYQVEQTLYSRQVLFGTIAYGLTTEGLGHLVKNFGAHVLLYTFPIVSIITAAVVFLVGASSSTPRMSDPSLNTLDAAGPGRASILQTIRVIASPRFLLFLSVILSIGMGRQIMNLFLPTYLASTVGLEKDQIGRVYLCSSFFSIIFLFSGPYLLRKLGVRLMLLVGLGAMTIRLGAYNYVTDRHAVIAVELLNGISFSFTHMGGVREAAQCAPEGWEATFQALYTATYVQIPAVFGSFIGGYLYEEYTGAVLLWGAACVSAGAFVIFSIFVIVGMFWQDRPCHNRYCISNEPGCEKP